MGRMGGFQQILTVAHKIARIEQASPAFLAFMERELPDFVTADRPFVGAGNSFEKYHRDRLGLPPSE